jgi:hypothetical protein
MPSRQRTQQSLPAKGTSGSRHQPIAKVAPAKHRLHPHLEPPRIAARPIVPQLVDPMPPVSDEALLAKYERLVIYISCNFVNKYGLREEEKDELQQCARYRLWRLRQDKRREHDYCVKTITNAMCSEWKKILKRKNSLVALDLHWHLELDPEAVSSDLINTLTADTDLVADAITQDREQQANDLLALLTPEEQLVIRLHVAPPPGERAIRDMRTLSKRSMARETRLPSVIASAMQKMRHAAGIEHSV